MHQHLAQRHAKFVLLEHTLTTLVQLTALSVALEPMFLFHRIGPSVAHVAQAHILVWLPQQLAPPVLLGPILLVWEQHNNAQCVLLGPIPLL